MNLTTSYELTLDSGTTICLTEAEAKDLHFILCEHFKTKNPEREGKFIDGDKVKKLMDKIKAIPQEANPPWAPPAPWKPSPPVYCKDL